MSVKQAIQKTKRSLALYGVLFILLALLRLTTGCAPAPAAGPPSDKLNLVATTTMLADLARELGGDHLEVTGLMGPGVDPHLYQASAGDAAALQNADVVLYNGLHLEGKMGDLFAALQDGGRAVICAGEGIDPDRLLEVPGTPGVYDPHVWFDVSLWQEAAAYTAERLGELDPAHRADYDANLSRYREELDGLDRYIRARAAELPEERRVLITAHDAFRYFGRAYGFEVRGLQGVSTSAEAGTADLSALADLIVERRLGAVFVESSVPPRTIEALRAAVKARGFDVAMGGQLYSDSLGDPDSDAGTYLGTFTANIDAIADGLK